MFKYSLMRPGLLHLLIGASALFLVSNSFATGQTHVEVYSAQAHVSRIEGIPHKEIEVEVRFVNPTAESLYIQVCDHPVRLDSIVAYVEYWTGKRWKEVPKLQREGIVYGDLPGEPFELKPGVVAGFPYLVGPKVALPPNAHLRLVVLARREHGMMGRGVPSPRFVTNVFTISEGAIRKTQ
jgi:hypothetical protein